MLRLDVVRLDPELALPAYARAGDAGIDLLARYDGTVRRAGGRLMMATGIAFALPQGYGGFVLPRSGLSSKHGVTLVNAPGLIDCGYRGEIIVPLLNTDPHDDYEVHRGDRIAQLVVQKVEQIEWHEVASFDGTHRGGGFGHTGR